MKNLFKISLIGIVTAVSVIACDPPKANIPSGPDSIKVDSSQKDLVKVDSAKQDTTVQATTIVKKDSVKK